VRGKNHPLKFKPNPELVSVFDRMLDAAPSGDYGQLAHFLHKAPDEGTPPFFENAQVKRALKLKPDASTEDVRWALAHETGRPRSSHVSPEDISKWADSKGLKGAARTALDYAVENYRAKAGKAEPKEFWQMTRKQFADYVSEQKRSYVDEELRLFKGRLSGEIKDGYGEGMWSRPGEREKNIRENITKLEERKRNPPAVDLPVGPDDPVTARSHEREVRKALETGKDVPAEVLADYPDLANGKTETFAPADHLADNDPQFIEDYYAGKVSDAEFIRKAKEAGLDRREIRAAVSDAREARKVASSQKVSESVRAGEVRGGRGKGRDGQNDVANPDILYQSSESEALKRFRAATARARDEKENGQSLILKARRAVILSGIPTLAKLTAAAGWRIVGTPVEEIAGGGLSKVAPKLAGRAPREGRTSLRAEMAALKSAFSMDTLREVRDKLKTGESDRDKLYGKHDEATDETVGHAWLDFFGRMHGALKVPPSAPSSTAHLRRGEHMPRETELTSQTRPRNSVSARKPMRIVSAPYSCKIIWQRARTRLLCATSDSRAETRGRRRRRSGRSYSPSSKSRRTT
jgi:hypothetical protein